MRACGLSSVLSVRDGATRPFSSTGAFDTRRAWRLAAIASLVVISAGCATVAPGTAPAPTQDPWENWNRKVFSFNDALDRTVVRPVAEVYRDYVPGFVRTGVDNVLGNLYDVWSTANQFLQFKFQTGVEMGMRVLTNTVLGAGGLLDPATEMGLTRRSEDFGQTLARWGFVSGPYVVLPLLGPSTVRDTGGFFVDRLASPSTLPETSSGQYAVLATELINTRANLLATGALLDQVALDKYVFVRDAYLSRRLDAIYDGAPPMETFQDEPADPASPTPASPAASAPPVAGRPAAPAATPRAPAPPAAAAPAASAPR